MLGRTAASASRASRAGVERPAGSEFLADAAAGSAFGRRIASVILRTYAMRMAAVFTISTATIGLRTGSLPRWLGYCGYAVALILLLVIEVTPWVELLFPLWILLVSIDTLFESLKGRQEAGTVQANQPIRRK